ncbi:MAG: heavy metal-binding domain-containing protein [Pirellulaceae bacterium]|nr:heavy metal-binding domain-containing protein [Pirellulaceae bacterium]
MLELFIGLLFFMVPAVVFGMIFGRTIEKRHLRRLDEHDSKYRGFLVTQVKSFPDAVPGNQPPTLICSEVVIASDYLKNFFASWRNFFGGEVRSYSRMTERAKREVVARLVTEAEALGYNAICNVRIETAEIGNRRQKGAQAMSSCIGYATAYHCSANKG